VITANHCRVRMFVFAIFAAAFTVKLGIWLICLKQDPVILLKAPNDC
jgi:hypothetical protein